MLQFVGDDVHEFVRCALLSCASLASMVSVQAAPQGDIARGAALVSNRSLGLCVLCHAVPGTPPSGQGTLAPDLAGVGARWSADQLRERLMAPERFNPGSLMPSYRRSQGLSQVAAARRGQPLFDDQQLEDVVAYLGTLR